MWKLLDKNRYSLDFSILFLWIIDKYYVYSFSVLPHWIVGLNRFLSHTQPHTDIFQSIPTTESKWDRCNWDARKVIEREYQQQKSTTTIFDQCYRLWRFRELETNTQTNEVYIYIYEMKQCKTKEWKKPHIYTNIHTEKDGYNKKTCSFFSS